MSRSIQVRYNIHERDLDRFPQEDEALGRKLTTTLSDSLSRGVPPPVLVVIHPDRVELIDLIPVLKERHPVHFFVSAAAGQPDVEAVGILGVLDLMRQGQVVGRQGVVFIEWPDCRWWHSALPLDNQMAMSGDRKPVLRRAVDGMPRPGGLGGWFSRARYQRLRLELQPNTPDIPETVIH